jgi:hypothetical protein
VCIFFYKIREKEARTGSGGVWHWWKGGGGRKRGRRMNMVQIMYTHICKYKNDTIETVTGIRGGG